MIKVALSKEEWEMAFISCIYVIDLHSLNMEATGLCVDSHTPKVILVSFKYVTPLVSL